MLILTTERRWFAGVGDRTQGLAGWGATRRPGFLAFRSQRKQLGGQKDAKEA